MKNPRFDYKRVTVVHIAQLQLIADAGGRCSWSNDAVGLHIRGLLVVDGLYDLRISTRGRFALRFLFRGQRVRITPSYRIPYMRGQTGVIEAVCDQTVDADGFDEWNYPVKRAIPETALSLRIDGQSGIWMVYRPIDLEAVFDRG